VDLNVWQRIKGWFRRKPAEVVPFREPWEGMFTPTPGRPAFNYAVTDHVERMVLPPGPDPANANPPDPAPDRPAQFVPPTCACCKCQPSIYRTYGDGTVLCVECAS
jgi:hypothetical protein